MPKIATIGEVMIELAPVDTNNDRLKSVSFAGDSYNTAVTLARLGADTGYITRLGEDNYSSQIIDFLTQEGVDTAAIERSGSRQPGLYMIQNIEGGERIFHYWRDQSAAKQLLESKSSQNHLAQYFGQCEWLYFSAISIAILDENARHTFFDLLAAFKAQGGKIAYDSNFRPKLWQSVDSARDWSMRAVSICDLALLTLDDEAELWGDDNALDAAKQRYGKFNSAEIVFKRGADNVCVLRDGKEYSIPVKPVSNVVDTTAAGDTFNAGYLASHISGGDPEASAKLGSKCAGIIIQHRGGVIDKNIFLSALKS